MKKAEIGVGRFYTDNKNGLREVIAEGAQYKAYDGVTDEDCLRYRAHSVNLLHTRLDPDETNMTRTSFAAWAVAEVPADAIGKWHLERSARLITKKLTGPQRAFLGAFDRDLTPTSLIEVHREEHRMAKVCREKTLIKSVPDRLKADEHSFELEFTPLGLAVLQQVHGSSEQV